LEPKTRALVEGGLWRSVDPAFTEKEENDQTGCTTCGIWTDSADGYLKVMLTRSSFFGRAVNCVINGR
jgi:hypothetical protein